MQRISLSQAFAQWQELAADLPQDDAPMLAESWNDYTDSLCKDGALCDLQYHYAPAYDEEMPGDGSRFDPLSDDREFILDALGVTMRDAECGAQSFEDFCADMGYDTDSRSAEKTWRACKVTAVGLARLFSDGMLRDLRELFEDF